MHTSGIAWSCLSIQINYGTDAATFQLASVVLMVVGVVRKALSTCLWSCHKHIGIRHNGDDFCKKSCMFTWRWICQCCGDLSGFREVSCWTASPCHQQRLAAGGGGWKLLLNKERTWWWCCCCWWLITVCSVKRIGCWRCWWWWWKWLIFQKMIWKKLVVEVVGIRFVDQKRNK